MGYRRFLAHLWILTTMWLQNLVTVLFCLRKCLVTKLVFSFLMWVKRGASDDFFFKKGTSSFSHVGEPLSNDERPWGCDLCLLGAQP